MDEMWNQFFSLRHDKPRTLQLQIRQQLIDAITNGLIGPNEPLPSSRNLASALKVARNTVIAAYKELEFDGYITPQERRGYYVNEQFYESYNSNDSEQSSNVESPIWHDKLITKKPSTQTNIHNPENWQSLPYSFTIGQLDKSLIPYYEWREVVRHSSTLPEIQKWNLDHVDNDDPSSRALSSNWVLGIFVFLGSISILSDGVLTSFSLDSVSISFCLVGISGFGLLSNRIFLVFGSLAVSIFLTSILALNFKYQSVRIDLKREVSFPIL